MVSGFMVDATTPYQQSNRRQRPPGSYCLGETHGHGAPGAGHARSAPWAWLSVVALLVAHVPPVWAVMPPWVYKDARDKAMFHVQVRVLQVTPPRPTPGTCEVVAEVVRIFRNRAGGLNVGDRIGFGISCLRAGDPIVPGGTLWTDARRLGQARFLEVFLNREGAQYDVPLWQSRIIERETDRPTWPVGER
jgi:hypothetical protein